MEHAYAAGLFDGEGCLTIGRAAKKPGYVYWIRIDIGMSNKALHLLDAMKNQYGGTLRKTRPATGKWEAATGWVLFGKEAESFLRNIQPWVYLKQEQLRLGLALRNLINELEGKWTPEARQRGEAMYLRMRELNRKGPQEAEGKSGWFARLVGGNWVTPQADMFADLGWEPYAGSWPQWGTMRNGYAYRLRRLVPRISEIGSSLWPTPRVAVLAGKAKATKTHGWDLPAAVKDSQEEQPTRYWPTPRAEKVGGYSSPDYRPTLEQAVTMLPTPRSAGGERGGRGDLLAVARTGKQSRRKTWRTPNASDWKNRGRRGKGQQIQLQTQTGGQLNPQWVEWLMGFPDGWTDLEDLETP